jgi:Zn-dependent M28 family amino/carboxypeptidase
MPRVQRAGIGPRFQGAAGGARRSILFIATTAEERGLLGARHYAQHPLYPLPDTLANINMASTRTATRDIQLTTSGKSTVDDLVRAHAGWAWKCMAMRIPSGQFLPRNQLSSRGLAYQWPTLVRACR